MLVIDALVALIVAFLVAALFAYPLGRPGPWGGFLWFFLLVFFGAWAIGVWAGPVGPVAWGVAWVPILVGAILIGLLVAAIPPRRPRTTTEAVAEAEAADAVGLFFWFLLLGLVLVIAFSYAV